MQKVEKLKSICLQYAAAIQLLIPSIYIPELDAAVGSFALDRSKPRRLLGRSQQLKLAAENSKICDSIMYEPPLRVHAKNQDGQFCRLYYVNLFLLHLMQEI